MKTEVYSWRVSAQKKLELEMEARRQGKSMAKLLDEISSEWLKVQQNSRSGDDAEQAARRRRIMKTVGTIRGGHPTRASRAGELVREIIREKYDRERNASRRTD
jgi:hypothetical protein